MLDADDDNDEGAIRIHRCFVKTLEIDFLVFLAMNGGEVKVSFNVAYDQHN